MGERVWRGERKPGKLGRSDGGTLIAELPAAVYLLLFVVFLPILDLAAMAARACVVHAAARNAAHYAARAGSFEQDSESGALSAKSIARLKVRQTLQSSLEGVAVEPSNVKVVIIGTPLKPSLPAIRQERVLEPSQLDGGDEEEALEILAGKKTEPPKSPYLFQTEVTVSGEVEPLLLLNKDLFGTIPGLTANFPVSASFREATENPSGLTR